MSRAEFARRLVAATSNTVASDAEHFALLRDLYNLIYAAWLAFKQAFIYTLATQTRCANWLTLTSFFILQGVDAQRGACDAINIPLSEWCDQVAAARTTCWQSESLSKMGNILSSVALGVAKALTARGYSPCKGVAG